MNFIDFIIFLCALITAGSTFAIAVEVIVGWDQAWPMVEALWRDTSIDDFLPPATNEVPATEN